MKRKFDAINFDGVASVGSTVKPDANIVFLAKDINNFSFAFVSPLSTENSANLPKLRFKMIWNVSNFKHEKREDSSKKKICNDQGRNVCIKGSLITPDIYNKL